jgi:ribosome maturation factor RimP
MPQASGSRSADASGAAAPARQRLLDLLTPVVTDAGFDLEDLTISAAGRRSVVRVVVDADAGVDLDGVAVVSRVVSDALDADAPGGTAFAGPYVLEVTSPGVERPLRDERHWRRAVGRLVQVPVGGQTLTARVVATGDDGVLLDDGAQHLVPWDQLGPGRVQVEFNRPGPADAAQGGE